MQASASPSIAPGSFWLKTESWNTVDESLLRERFGPPPELLRARIATATPELLDAWAKRLFSATTLDDVLAP